MNLRVHYLVFSPIFQYVNGRHLRLSYFCARLMTAVVKGIFRFCSVCKRYVSASKKLDLYSLPNNLIVHLKRFRKSSVDDGKDSTFVEIPVK